jgi:hypothetical protein
LHEVVGQVLRVIVQPFAAGVALPALAAVQRLQRFADALMQAVARRIGFSSS